MNNDISEVGILVRREIEALMAVPLIEAFSEETGREQALAIARKVVSSLAEESGRSLARQFGGNSLKDFAGVFSIFNKSGALDFEVVESTDTSLVINVKRCLYAEMYERSGLAGYGFLLSCGRDYALAAGFNPAIKLTRTQTIMEGADCCDFLF